MLNKFLARKRTKMVNRLIPSQCRRGRILDIGCGEYPFFLIGTEFCEKHAIDKIAREGTFDNGGKENILIKKCDIEKDGLRFFDNEYFDVVTMLAVIEHLEPGRLLYMVREVNRILRLGGIFILTTPAPRGDIILQILAKLELIDSELLKEHKALYSPKRISSLLTQGGFSKEHIKLGRFELFMNIWSVATKSIER